jgi:glycosyltransferase involved in cell wall biosynthesis
MADQFSPKADSLTCIVPVLNGEKYIGACLHALTSQLRPGDELIVADNGSTDRTIEIVGSFATARLQRHPGMTVAALRNKGAAQASGALLAFVDSDCLVQENWRAEIIRVMTDQTIAASGSMPDIAPDAPWVERAWGSLKYRRPRPVHYIPAMNFVMRADWFKKINGFDPNLVTDEDTDICYRLIQAGGKIFEDPRIAALHLGNPKSIASFIAKEKWHASSIMATRQLHGTDRAMTMTFAFMGLFASAILLLAGSIFGVTPWYLWPLALLAVPVATSFFRAQQYGIWSTFPALVLLYVIFYGIRSSVILRHWFGGKETSSARR